MGARCAGVLQLRPVTFAYKDEAPGTTHYASSPKKSPTFTRSW